MGLSHHWSRPCELPAGTFANAVRDVQRAVSTMGIPLAGFQGVGEPVFREDVIVFNGSGAAAVEPFEIRQTEFDRRGRSEVRGYCKTNYAPYDACVRVALVVLKQHLGEVFVVGSDERDAGWPAARAHCQAVLGYGSDFVLDNR